MHSKDFPYLQYNDLNWPHQVSSNLNRFIHNFIIDGIIAKNPASVLRIFDIGFGIGSFIRLLIEKLSDRDRLVIEGCEPSDKNYGYFMTVPLPLTGGVSLKTHPAAYLDVETGSGFDFITAIYVFSHIRREEFDATVKKVHSMLATGGRFVMVVVNEHYLRGMLESKNETFTLLQKSEIDYGGKKFAEYMHHTDLPGIGRILDYSREEKYYVEIFGDNGLSLVMKTDMDDSGYINTVFVFQKV